MKKAFYLLIVFSLTSFVSFCTNHRFVQLHDYEAKEDVDKLIIILEKDPDNYLRAQAAQSLGRMKKGKKSVPNLIKALSNKEWVVRYYAAESLGRLGAPKGRSALEKLLKTESDENVSMVIKAALEQKNPSDN